jgi:hypothetical protein
MTVDAVLADLVEAHAIACELVVLDARYGDHAELADVRRRLELVQALLLVKLCALFLNTAHAQHLPPPWDYTVH